MEGILDYSSDGSENKSAPTREEKCVNEDISPPVQKKLKIASPEELEEGEISEDKQQRALKLKEPVPSSCQICHVQAKYRCPACDTRTCSALCSKKHKANTGCTGLRCKTAFVRVSEFTDNNLFSDYQFLEEIGRSCDNVKRIVGTDKSFHRPPQRKPVVHAAEPTTPITSDIPYHLRQLQYSAKTRNVTLHIMPKIMTRRKVNTTSYDHSKKKLYWRVEFIAEDSFGVATKLVSPHADEEHTLDHVFAAHVEDVPSRLRFRKLLRKEGLVAHTASGPFYDMSDDENSDDDHKSKNSDHNKAFPVVYLLEVAFSKEPSYYVLDGQSPLGVELRHKHIIEYPVIHVVKEDETYAYHIIQSPQPPASTEPPAPLASNITASDQTVTSNTMTSNQTVKSATTASDQTVTSNTIASETPSDATRAPPSHAAPALPHSHIDPALPHSHTDPAPAPPSAHSEWKDSLL